MDVFIELYHYFYYHLIYNFPFKSILKYKKYFYLPKWHLYTGKFYFGGPIRTNRIDPIVDIFWNDIIWKDKFDCPRVERSPSINIIFFRKWQIYISAFSRKFSEDSFDPDLYWEMMIWTFEYCEGDINIARRTWPWRNMNGLSTWEELYIKKKWRERKFQKS